MTFVASALTVMAIVVGLCAMRALRSGSADTILNSFDFDASKGLERQRQA